MTRAVLQRLLGCAIVICVEEVEQLALAKPTKASMAEGNCLPVRHMPVKLPQHCCQKLLFDGVTQALTLNH